MVRTEAFIPPSPVIGEAKYIVYADGSTIKAFNGITNSIDYSGTDAVTVINNALSSGGMVVLRNAVYGLSSSVVISISGTVLQFESWSSILSANNAMNINPIVIQDASNVRVTGGRINGNAANQSSTSFILGSALLVNSHSGTVKNVWIDHMYIFDSASHGVLIQKDQTTGGNFCQNIHVEDNVLDTIGENWPAKILGTTGYGVLISRGMQDIWVEDNEMYSVFSIGASILGYNFDTSSPWNQNIYINRNVIREYGRYGIDTSGTLNLVVKDNTIVTTSVTAVDASHYGIFQEADATGPCIKSTYENNYINRVGFIGILIGKTNNVLSKDTTIRGNHIENVVNSGGSTSAWAIQTIVDKSIIEKNVIDNSSSAMICGGILCYTSANQAQVFGNVIHDLSSGTAIKVYGTANIIRENSIYNSIGTAVNAVSGATSTVRTNNFISGTITTVFTGTTYLDIADSNLGYVTYNAGSSVGTGAQQTIAHGLSFTPTQQQIVLIPGYSGVGPYQSAAPDATNIFVTALSGRGYWWTVSKL